MIKILCGKSASGKDYTLRKLKKEGYIPIISYTSRPIREKETNGVEYNFVSEKEFKNMIESSEMLEYRAYNTCHGIWYYGLKKQELDLNKDYVVILDLNGAKSFIDYYGKDNCELTYLNVSKKERERRARLRGSFDENEWNRRLIADDIDFSDDKLREMGIDY